MDLSLDQRVWNRAALESGGASPREGDRALAALLLAHGMIMNGGVVHALESLSSAEVEAAIAGYRFYSLLDVARLLAAAAEDLDGDEAADHADAKYAEAVRDDDALFERFRAVFTELPDLFSPA